MLRMLKWLFLAVLSITGLAAAYGAYIVFINPSLHMTIDKQTFAMALESPEMLTELGAIEGTMLDYHSGRLNDVSWDKRARDYDTARRNLAAIEAYDLRALKGQERLTYEVMSWNLKSQLGFERIKWLAPGDTPYPINQMFGEQNGFPRFMQFTHAVKNDATASTYVARLNALGEKFDQIIDVVKRQAAMGAVPPTFVFDKVLTEMHGFIAMPVRENPLYATYVTRLDEIGLSAERQSELAASAETAITDVVYPAYRRMIETMQTLKAQSTPDAGVWKQPDGSAYYALVLAQQTTTDLTPQQVHDLGLSEVDRITAEMDAILKSQGLTEGSVGARMKALGEDPRFGWEDSDAGRAAILAEYTRIIAEVNALMPQYFSSIPAQPVEVVRVPVFSEGGSAGAYYNQPAMDGSRPGRFFANLRDVRETPKWSMKTLAYHEAIPGHHFQIATAMNLDLPLARTYSFFTAYVEGWALYAERLALDIGMYKDDPFGDLGRLQAELFRAVRLVVDTGIHFKRWSREQAIDYMASTTGMALGDVTAEIERYAVMPGQACSYKIGMIKILELREKAKAALGERFDLKSFHSVVLDNGALPLQVLEKVVDEWIAGKGGA
jgi:uncharacterized protein (DUF885 family)